MRPQLDYYDSLIEEAAALLARLANRDPLVDGNGRSAFAAAGAFLHLNGCYIACDSRETYDLSMRQFQTHTFRSAQLRTWLEENVKPLPAI